MNHNELPEKPLFTDDNEDCGNFSDQDLSLEELKEKAAINRQGKTLDFCLSSAKWIAPIAFILIAADLLLQHLKMVTTLLLTKTVQTFRKDKNNCLLLPEH